MQFDMLEIIFQYATREAKKNHKSPYDTEIELEPFIQRFADLNGTRYETAFESYFAVLERLGFVTVNREPQKWVFSLPKGQANEDATFSIINRAIRFPEDKSL